MPPQAESAPGMGLKIMRYRARILGGEVSFERSTPTGTRIVCECPIELSATKVKSERKTVKPSGRKLGMKQ
jgi:nitrate/nitrite-specific signal transduction histidine kinase